MSPIFIVGAPRSGTTLLATLLSSHSRISCSAETHFFPYLAANHHQVAAVLRDRQWPTAATEFVTNLTVEDHKVHDLFGITSQAIDDYLATQKPSIQALLESLTVQHMVATQKGRWAEKTPNHMLHLSTIRRLYPTAKIVRIVRDPRDSAYSIAHKLPWASRVPLENAYLIQEWHQKSASFFERDHLTYTLRYEDLIAQPAAVLQKLCAFLGEPFEPGMLETEKAAQHTAPQHESWKEQVGQKLDQSRCYAWRSHMDSIENAAISAVCQTMISRFNYEPIKSNLRVFFSHYTSYTFIQAHSQEMQTLLQQKAILMPCELSALQANDQVFYCDIPIYGTDYNKSFQKFVTVFLHLIFLYLKRVNVKFSHFCLCPAQDSNIFRTLAAYVLMEVGSTAELTDFMKG